MTSRELFVRARGAGFMAQVGDLMKIKSIKELLRHFKRDSGNGLRGSTSTLVGSDSYGNKYYKDSSAIFGKDRYVVYNENSITHMAVDASMISPEWHAWIHHINDEAPVTYNPKYKMTWEPNPTGTSRAYVPFSTVTPKIKSWDYTTASKK